MDDDEGGLGCWLAAAGLLFNRPWPAAGDGTDAGGEGVRGTHDARRFPNWTELGWHEVH